MFEVKNWRHWAAVAAPPIVCLILATVALRALYPTTWPGRVGRDRDWAMVCGSGYLTMGIKTDGSLWAWGNNRHGRFGDGTTTSRSSPTRVGWDRDWVFVSVGPGQDTGHTAAIKRDGSLWTWGDNRWGQLGNDADEDGFPAQVGESYYWASVSVGASHTVAIKTDGSLWAWGSNNVDQLGNRGLGEGSPIPVRVGTGYDWASVSAGRGHTMAIGTDGSLWFWGTKRSRSGALLRSSNIPMPMIGTDWVYVSASEVSFAIRADGSLWGFGGNRFGQVGNGTWEDLRSLTRVGRNYRWVSASSGNYHSAGIKTDGSLWTWGRNDVEGRLGSGILSRDRNRPRRIRRGANWNHAVATGNHVMATRANGTLWAWGRDDGQLGRRSP